MIDTPNIGPLGKGPSKNLEDITDATKKEGIDSLSSNKKVILHSHLDGKEIAFRKNIEAFLEQAINKDQFNLGKITDYHIFTEGVSSVVARIATEDGKEFIGTLHPYFYNRFDKTNQLADITDPKEKENAEKVMDIIITVKEGKATKENIQTMQVALNDLKAYPVTHRKEQKDGIPGPYTQVALQNYVFKYLKNSSQVV